MNSKSTRHIYPTTSDYSGSSDEIAALNEKMDRMLGALERVFDLCAATQQYVLISSIASGQENGAPKFPSLFCTRVRAAEILGVSQSTLERMIASGMLQTYEKKYVFVGSISKLMQNHPVDEREVASCGEESSSRMEPSIEELDDQICALSRAKAMAKRSEVKARLPKTEDSTKSNKYCAGGLDFYAACFPKKR